MLYLAIFVLCWVWAIPKSRHLRRKWVSAPVMQVDGAIVLDLASAGLGAGLAVPRTLKALDLALTGGEGIAAVPGPGLWDDDGRRRSATRGLGRVARAGRRPGGAGRMPGGVGRASGRVGRSPGFLTQVANLLLMGATWEEAWEDCPARFTRLRDSLGAAWVDGAAPVPLLERAAKTMRLQRQRNAKEAAAKLGARLVLPLGLCFLPAFVLIGVVPVVAGAAGLLF